MRAYATRHDLMKLDLLHDKIDIVSQNVDIVSACQ
jgi:hypothetical protein